MASVLFIQTDSFEHLGILSVAASVREHGHRVGLILGRSAARVARVVEKQRPDIVALSATTGAHRKALSVARAIRSRINVITVLGGPHATFFPEVIASEGIDLICRGEGELAFLRLLEALDVGVDPIHVRGFWVKKPQGVVHRSPPAELIDDLDALPLPARDLLSLADPDYARSGVRRVMVGRGCPYRCSYCFNHAQRRLISGRVPYVRTRSVEHVIEELQSLKRLGARTINFVDDTFGISPTWTYDFCRRYGAEIRLPFLVNLRPEQITDELVQQLAKSGCYCVQMGVESANPVLRRTLLARGHDNRTIETAAGHIRRAGIKLLTHNMLGLPGETLEEAAATLAWNDAIRADFPRVSLFQPYPRTELGDQVRAGAFGRTRPIDSESIPESFFRSSPLAGRDVRRIENLHKLFFPFIQYRWLRRPLLALTSLPKNPLFELVFLATIGMQYRSATNRSWFETLRFGLKNLAVYFR